MALAPSSRKSYTRAVQEFLDFRHQYNLPETRPVPYEQIAQFCVYHRRRGLAPQSIRAKLSALAYWFKAQGLSDPTDDFRIHKFLTGWSRQRGHPRDDRQPMTPAILKGLKQLWPRLCTSYYEQVLYHSAALTAFFGALRVSELVALSKSDTSHRALLISDVKVFQDSMEIRVRASKTDQEAKGQVIRLLKCSEEDLCPVVAMTQFAALRGIGKGYLFSHQDGKPLTKYQFWTITAKALDLLGMGHLKFGTHSFRIGAATTASALGYNKDEIKAIGRWRSGAFRGYVRSVPS
ncbi:tyrosine recombinase XerC-like [Anolis sagrei]|uniref:tyrosine recombinase XerC-like n=1 Tax=Anolis sagrei TaxID=38937 RepID=UPI0035206E6B